jgi:hypothetical protein
MYVLPKRRAASQNIANNEPEVWNLADSLFSIERRIISESEVQ